MAVRLEGTVRHYSGTSADEKPRWVNTAETRAVPSGSRFLETDTGREFRFDGGAWRPLAQQADALAEETDQTDLLTAILRELRLTRALWENELGEDAEALLDDTGDGD